MQFFLLFVLMTAASAQDDGITTPATTTSGDVSKPPNLDAGALGDEGEAGGEDCEEAWEYLEFLKSEIKEKIENILQKTLFEPKKLLEETVSDTMTKSLEIRDAILARIKSLRNGELKTCPDQGVNQDQFLAVLRMETMGVLLKLIEPNSAQTEKLQEIGKDLLAIRSKVNGEITRIIMLREAKGSIRSSDSACDCGILKDISDGLSEIINKTAQNDSNALAMLSMILMNVDGRIGILYNEILGQLEDEKRAKSIDELKSLKEISTSLNDLIAKMADVKVDSEEGSRKLDQIVDRDVAKLRNDVERQLQQCRKNCPSDCESCGSKKIDELLQKFQDFNATIVDSDENEAKESIRSELMQFLGAANNEMTELLTQKANDGELPQCEAETLEVLEKFKGPLWMMVNVTIFGDLETMNKMLAAMNDAFEEMRGTYCSSNATAVPRENPDECDQQEITNTQKWISDIDSIISTNIFKPKDESGKVNTMLGFIKLKSDLDERVRNLFADGYKCGEEVNQIKNVYMGMVSECLSEMMNPNYEFKSISRAERVQCIKQMRVTMEDRRGELLLREVGRRIIQEALAEADAEYPVETDTEVVPSASG